ncbi:MAG: FkbM family methyltransferase [Acidimicrobiia bacterium]
MALPQTSTPTVRIDDVLGAGATVDLVKIDIDGGEAEALKGMCSHFAPARTRLSSPNTTPGSTRWDPGRPRRSDRSYATWGSA